MSQPTSTQIQSSATTTNTSSPSSTSSTTTTFAGTTVSKGAIAGIVLGGLVGIALLLCGILLVLRLRKNRNKGDRTDYENDHLNMGGNHGYSHVVGSQETRHQYPAADPWSTQMPIGSGARDHLLESPDQRSRH